MLVNPVSLLMPAPLQETRQAAPSPGGTEAVARSFSDLLQQKLGELNNLQQQADALTQEYLAGQVQDVHQVMLALEQANLSLQLAMQVRNKAVEAYQEISRMQV
ncbi:flagellar hook-basal body complex protein FliE [Moorella sp. Hama-1]|uniref:flagellar hook-basal body complex protein FliE n=1 Tax=Moorella sp. Hama-1 TaxID=2138101 RepID=UPI000D65A161|nr:flagellar hook-basal body complex protein FliE [Moorella sp. Hama-1]MDN5362878.1 flagellar hook-basal body complex protein FliE [Moorella sp. (in: firmicutes)]BCV20807.1 flagellar hook-basal body complex protein FliE [Moorella sp. Hama-1]